MKTEKTVPTDQELEILKVVWARGEATVREVFLDEQSRLISLPDNPYPCNEVETVTIGKTPYALYLQD